MTFKDFAEHAHSRRAQLLPAHVLALRVYTTSAFRSLNDPLRQGTRPHPLPITIAFLTDGVRRLRAVSANRDDAYMRQDFWRGMRNVELGQALPDSFHTKGGTEQAPMSTTSDFAVALHYSAGSQTRLLFKVTTAGFMERGASVQYLSAFPAEAESLFPPLTYLRPTGEIEHVEVEMMTGLVGKKVASMVNFTIVEVSPHFPS